MGKACGVLPLVLCAVWASAAPADAQPQAPPGYHLLTAPQVTGGHLVGTRQGSGSATTLLGIALTEVAGFFDGRPQAVGGARDAADQQAEAVFRATLRGSAVGGIAYALVGQGTGTTGFVFDSPQTLRQSLPRLLPLAGGGGGRAAAPAQNWRETPFPDGSGAMQLPEGWVITFAHKGMASAKGPHGWIERGLAMQVKTRAAAAQFSALAQAAIGQPKPWPGPVADPTNPVTALQEMNVWFNAQAQQTGNTATTILRIIEVAPVSPAPGFQQAAYIHYEVDIRGVRCRLLRFLMLSHVGPDGLWMAYSTYVGSPADAFPQHLPVLLQIWGSARTAQHVIDEKLGEALQSLKEVGEIARQTAQTRERAQQRIHDKWTEVMRGTRIVEDTLTGERRDVGLGYSHELVRRLNEGAGTDRYREIPLWQLNQ